MHEPVEIDVCVCTYQRPQLLARLLRELARQRSEGAFTLSVVVVDNDDPPSAEHVVRNAATYGYPLTYCTQPERNISLTRNRALESAKADLVAFIDDDEFPSPDWLFSLLSALRTYGAAGVLGPVRPHFDEPPPSWLLKGGFYERKEYVTGTVVPWHDCRTGNVLFHRGIVQGVSPIFRPEFGTGSEDVDFFRRMTRLGHRFVWCNEAVVFETIPPGRWRHSVMIQRALQRGGNSLKHPEGRHRGILKAIIAIPLYALALPFLQLGGHHLFMKYLIRLCDHVGRLSAFLGIRLIRDRVM
jgi:glycosyltransferase involved in cell wall biosynthesis